MINKTNQINLSQREKFLIIGIIFILGCCCSFFINVSSVSNTVQTSVAETIVAQPTLTPVIVTVLHTQVAEMLITEQVTTVITRQVTRILVVTQVVEKPVTVTFTNTPINTSTPSDTPTITLTPSNTPTPTPSSTPTLTPIPSPTPNLAQTATVQAFGVLASPKSNGFYTVGTEIIAGKWESTGVGNDCYWARYDVNQNILSNHFGLAGGTITISPTDYEVEFNDCGTWVYVEGAARILETNAAQPKGDGFYTVGVEIAIGRWESTGTSDSCYWARLDSNQNIIGNHFGNSGGTVTIRSSDYEVQFDGCGIWNYLGP